MQTPFPCIQCGLCCNNIKNVKQLQKLDNGMGKCIHLREDKLCEVYATRPFWCNIAKAYDKVFQNNISEYEFIIQNLKICIELNRKAGDAENISKLINILNKL